MKTRVMCHRAQHTTKKYNRYRHDAERVTRTATHLPVTAGPDGVQKDVIIDNHPFLQPVSRGGFGVHHVRRDLSLVELYVGGFLHSVRSGGGWYGVLIPSYGLQGAGGA